MRLLWAWVAMVFMLVSSSVIAGDGIGYDPNADPFEDLAEAQDQARESNRRILLFLGGEWCVWCHHLHDFLEREIALKQQLDRSFVAVKINYSDENPNQEFFAQYPEFPGFPHLFVLDAEGQLLRSQGTEPLEEGKSYSVKAFKAFIDEWGPDPEP